MTPYSRLLERGHAARLAGRFIAASRHYAAAERIASSSQETADALAGLGMVARGLCDYRRAIALLNRALAVYRRLRDDEGRAFALYARGGARRFLGDFRPAERDLAAALALAPDHESEIFTRMALGGLHRMTGRLEESLDEYRAARGMAGRQRLSYAMAYADCGIGNAFRLLGERSAARRHLDLAEARYRSIGDRVSRPYTLFAILLMDLEDGRSGRFAGMERLFRATNDRRGLVYAELARAVRHLDRAEAKKAAGRALARAKTLGLKLEAMHARRLLLGPDAAAVRAGYHRLGAAPPKTIHGIP